MKRFGVGSTGAFLLNKKIVGNNKKTLALLGFVAYNKGNRAARGIFLSGAKAGRFTLGFLYFPPHRFADGAVF
jgi:hypothetical protein